jgi:hypothetical protein
MWTETPQPADIAHAIIAHIGKCIKIGKPFGEYSLHLIMQIVQ